MGLDLRTDCTFLGPAFPEPFVLLELEPELSKLGLLPKTTGIEGQALRASWDAYRRKVRELAVRGGALRVRNHVVEPLVERLGYARLVPADEVETREGAERGGDLMVTADGGAKLRIWCTDLDEDLAAPARRGAAWRYSHLRIAQRVLLASGERVALLTNGTELHLLVCDPARPDSEIVIAIDPSWKMSREVPDSYRLVLALSSPGGVRAIPDLIDKARLQQVRVTKELRRQARQAVERFVQEVLDHPENHAALREHTDRARLARDLWREGLITVYRVLFVLKLESSGDSGRAFSFASTALWRSTFSPSVALARPTRAVLDTGAETGHLLEEGLRALFRMFTEGLQCTELNVQPLGGALFGVEATPVLSPLRWGERAVANLLDRLLWTETKVGRERVHYGPLDVEDLGRVYETLLELEPGIASETMCRLRRQKLEVVVPLAQGEKYRAVPVVAEAEDEDSVQEDEEGDGETSAAEKKTHVEWVEEVRPGEFYLRVGLGRKSTGSYYTPHSFVRFLVQETLGPQVAERSPHGDPQPAEILKLKVLDPAMGSGHFLVEACRFLGRALYEACRLCDERALAAERRAEAAKPTSELETALVEAADYRGRLAALPDPDQEVVRYLPSRASEGQESGFSQRKAEALCRRLVAVHCLYGVDKNPLAVELAKLALWIESHAEGLPLTFLDHRLVLGDSLTGPFFEHLLTYPGAQITMDDLFTRGLRESFTAALGEALKHVHDLEASAGVTVAEVAAKRAAKTRLDRALAPFRAVAAAWAGGIMLGPQGCDDAAYARLVRAVGDTCELPPSLTGEPRLLAMIASGLGVEAAPAEAQDLVALVASGRSISALPYDLTFAEVFFPLGMLASRIGFDAVVGNPPWDAIQFKSKEFFASFDFEILGAPTKRERTRIEGRLLSEPLCRQLFDYQVESFEQHKRANDALYKYQKVEVEGDLAGRQIDAFRVFMERNASLLRLNGATGIVVPSAFHANEGATGVRRLYLEQMALRCCYSFENRRKLFEIDSRFKFALVVAERGGPTSEFPCAFYLHDDEWLFGDRSNREPLRYTLDFVRRTGGEYLSLLELRSAVDLNVARTCFSKSETFHNVCRGLGIQLGAECHMTHDAWRFTPTMEVLPGGEDPRDHEVAKRLLDLGYLVLHEGKTFRQYEDHWDKSPRYLVALDKLSDKPAFLHNVRFFRLAHRNIAGPGDENVSIWTLHPPTTLHGHSCVTETTVKDRPNSAALWLLAVVNSYVFDYLLTLRVRANVLGFMRDAQPVPSAPPRGFLAHSATRLVCNHEGFARLWLEQVGEAWREPGPRFAWPVLGGDDERWQVRAMIDAVVAGAYCLSRAQYEHLLSAFSHKSYPKAPALCLERFDELNAIGLETFTRKYDPYWDLEMNQTPPQPVVDVPVPADSAGVREQSVLYGEGDTLGEAKRAAEQHAPYGAVDQRQVRARRRRGGRGRGRRG